MRVGASGRVELDDGLVVDAGLTRETVLGWPVEREMVPGGAVSLPTLPGGFAATIRFRADGPVASVELMDTHPRFGASWNDWTAEKEDARHAAHLAWLEAWGVANGEVVTAVRHQRGGFSHIRICYPE